MQKKGKNGRMVGEEREGKSRMETGGRKEYGEARPSEAQWETVLAPLLMEL